MIFHMWVFYTTYTCFDINLSPLLVISHTKAAKGPHNILLSTEGPGYTPLIRTAGSCTFFSYLHCRMYQWCIRGQWTAFALALPLPLLSSHH